MKSSITKPEERVRKVLGVSLGIIGIVIVCYGLFQKATDPDFGSESFSTIILIGLFLSLAPPIYQNRDYRIVNPISVSSRKNQIIKNYIMQFLILTFFYIISYDNYPGLAGIFGVSTFYPPYTVRYVSRQFCYFAAIINAVYTSIIDDGSLGAFLKHITLMLFSSVFFFGFIIVPRVLVTDPLSISYEYNPNEPIIIDGYASRPDYKPMKHLSYGAVILCKEPVRVVPRHAFL